MKLSSIQAIVFDARFPKLQPSNPRREEALLRYVQPLFRESLERLSVLGYTLWWLDDDSVYASEFLKKHHIIHFFRNIYIFCATPPPPEPPPVHPLERLFRDSAYLPQQVLYLSFQLHSSYILAKSMGCACFLFQEEAAEGSLRPCLPKLYALVPWLIKSKGLAPLYWNGPRRTVLQSYLGMGGFSPLGGSKNLKSLGSLVDAALQKLQPTNASLEEAIVQSWEMIVGAKLASQSRPGRLVKGRQLVILAYNAIIKQELYFQARPILKRLQGLPGGEQLVEISVQQRG